MNNKYIIKSVIVLLMLFTGITYAQVTNTTQNNEYTTISAAITAAQPGDVIEVDAGTYTENLTVNKSITLMGPNAGTPGAGTRGTEAVLSNSKVTFSGTITAVLDGFRIFQTGNTNDVVSIGATSAVTVRNNVFVRNGVDTGIVARGVLISTGATAAISISDNLFTGDDSNDLFSTHKTWNTGVWSNGGTNTSISGNTFTKTRTGINIDNYSAGVSISGNNFTDNGTHIAIGGSTPVNGSYTLAANEFGAPRSAYINLSNVNAAFRLNVVSSTFGGQQAANLTLAQQFTIEAGMYHKGRSNRNGLVTYVPNQLFVIPGIHATAVQQAVNYAAAGNVVNVAEGTYFEEVSVSKSISLVGANPVTTILTSSATSGSRTVMLNANDIFFSGFTVTRDVANLSAWLSATKNNGIIIGQNRSGIVLDNIIVKRNRNGIYFAKSQVTVTNSLIEENRTGLNIDGNLSGTIISNNIIRNNLTHGIAFNNNTGNLMNVTGVIVTNNSITGNYHSQIGFLSDINSPITGTVSATCNWLGTDTPITNGVATTEPSYTTQEPAFFGGTQPDSPIDGHLAGAGIASLTGTPHLTVDTNNAESGVGFFGDLESCDAVTTKVIESQCGTTVITLNKDIFAEHITGATTHRFRVNNGVTTEVFETSNSYFAINQLSSVSYGTAYTIEVSAFVNGAWTIYGPACVVNSPAIPLTKLTTASCGSTVSSFNTNIFANVIPYVDRYRFRAVSLAQGEQFYETSNNYFKINQLAAYSYLTTYTITVSVRSNGVWSDYGDACTVSTPEAIPTTQLMPMNCGATVASLNTNIFANTVPGATLYRFRVTSSYAPAGTQVIDVTNNYFKLNMLTTATYGTTYTIDVAVQADGEWSEFGNTCTVNSPATQALSFLKSISCGATVASRNTDIFAQDVAGVTTYRFRVTSSLGTHTVDRPVNYFKLNQLPVTIPAGETVVIAVMTISQFNGISTAYGNNCNLTLSNLAGRMSADGGTVKEGTIVKANTYPNPFVAGFTVAMETKSQEMVNVTVYDMAGRPLESFKALPSELGNKQFGSGYASGVYNIVVTQGGETKMLHVVKD